MLVVISLLPLALSVAGAPLTPQRRQSLPLPNFPTDGLVVLNSGLAVGADTSNLDPQASFSGPRVKSPTEQIAFLSSEVDKTSSKLPTSTLASTTAVTSPIESAVDDTPVSPLVPSGLLSSTFAPTPTASPIVAAYYPDWGADTLSPEDVDFDRFDWIDFAFAVPNATFGLEFSNTSSEKLLSRLVDTAHKKSKNVKLSIGGWDGSTHFSNAMSTSENRAQFVDNIRQTYTSFGLDGIDIDWEYPGQAGAQGNGMSQADSDNFLVFLQLLRTILPPEARISAACQTQPFADASGKPMSNVTEFGSVLDWILIMNYDTWDSSPTPGANAPFDNACGNSSQPESNAKSAIKSWTSAGFPADKIMLGVPSYGYLSKSAATQLHDRRDLTLTIPTQTSETPVVQPFVTSISTTRLPSANAQVEVGGIDAVTGTYTTYVTEVTTMTSHSTKGVTFLSSTLGEQATETSSQVGEAVSVLPTVALSWLSQLLGQQENPSTEQVESSNEAVRNDDDGGTDSGQVQFRSLVTQGALQKDGAGVYVGGNGFTRYWDQCSSTPFLKSESVKQIITYDDAESLELKAVLARDMGLLGVNMFDAHGDTKQWDLTDAVRRGLGRSA